MTRDTMTTVLLDAARAGGWSTAITPIIDAMPMRKLEVLADSLSAPETSEMSLEEMEAMLDTGPGGGASRSDVAAKVLAAADECVARSIFDELSLSAVRTLYNRHVGLQSHVAAAVRYAVVYSGRDQADAERAAAVAVAAGASDFTTIYQRILAA